MASLEMKQAEQKNDLHPAATIVNNIWDVIDKDGIPLFLVLCIRVWRLPLFLHCPPSTPATPWRHIRPRHPGDGHVTQHEFAEVMRAMGENVDESDLNFIFRV